MQFDDRLATVLRMRAGSDAALRTQFRQLVDLLGSRPTPWNSRTLDRLARRAATLPAAERERLILAPALRRSNPHLATLCGFIRLDEVRKNLPQEEQSRILREPGLRLRNPDLVGFLAAGEAKPSASAMATARLSDAQWLELIPQLPVTARGFLRHRRDLSPQVKDLLAQLGIGDLVLPDPGLAAEPAAQAEPAPAAPASAPRPSAVPGNEGIGALLRRIEAFREERRTRPVAPRLPLEEEHAEEPLLGFEFTTDAAGEVTWASSPVAPLAVGLRLTAPRPGALTTFTGRIAARLAAQQPIWSAALTLEAAPDISGEWRMDAAPLFDPQTGGFAGYRGCLRRPAVKADDTAADSEGDLMRQVLHELRTPVNAIQGFAEIIQQQLFGPAPHEYRAHAAAISVDAAKLLAGFDEVDRLVKLGAGAQALEAGESDMRIIVSETTKRLQGVLRPRNAGFKLRVKGANFTVGIDRGEVMALCWRLLATAAGAIGPGEEIALTLSDKQDRIRLRMKLPRALLDRKHGTGRDSTDAQRQRAVSAGMFGPEFSFRLAQAEAAAAGGFLKFKKERVTLVVPALTASDGAHSAGTGRASG